MQYSSENAETLEKQRSELPSSGWDSNFNYFLIEFMRVKNDMKFFVAVKSLGFHVFGF